MVSFISFCLCLQYGWMLTAAGEDALANLSIEQKGENGPITGFVRIRSRSQGLALSLGSLKGLNKIGSTGN